ncbi:MAG: SMP-30/gluconolactonase/LRE family protein [Acidimicrobiia bacterium]
MAAALAMAVAVPGPASTLELFPEVIELPHGWMPEGIAAGSGPVMYSGSLATGQVLAVDVITGQSHLVVEDPAGAPAVGLELDRWGRLWVAGGNSGQAWVYDAETGATLAVFDLAVARPTFINDVVVTRDGAWFTDSNNPYLYKVPLEPGGDIGEPEALSLGGDYNHLPGFNLNGIDATPGERWLIAVQSSVGVLYRIDPETGEAVVLDLGGETVVNGDGILVEGLRLYVVQNRNNQVAVIDLDPTSFAAGEVVGRFTSPHFDVPTTMAVFGGWFYFVNARFTTPATPETTYTMVAVPR